MTTLVETTPARVAETTRYRDLIDVLRVYHVIYGSLLHHREQRERASNYLHAYRSLA
jgi:hypothetical protein